LAEIIKIPQTKVPIRNRKRVAAYARVSVDKGEALESLATQISYYSQKIQQNPQWQYVGVYADEGISGTGFKGRNEMKRLLDDCKKGKIDIILTKSISRFARNTVDLLSTVRRLREIGVAIHFERENIYSLSSDGELMLSILASYAQEESRSTSENIKWSIRKRYANGEFQGYSMYGYEWTGERFKIIPHEAEAIRFMYQAFVDGMTMTQISKALAEKGIFNRKGKPFGQTSIGRIFDQEKYRGFSILQRTFVENHITHQKKLNKGELPKYVVQNTHPRIISEELHKKLEDERKRRRECGVVQWKSATVFTRKIECGTCRATYTFSSRESPLGDSPFQQGFYLCSTKRKDGVKSCNSKNLPLYTLKQICCRILGPLANAPEDSPFQDSWVEDLVEKIIVHPATITFLLKSGEEITTKWKNTASRDYKAFMRALVKEHASHPDNEEQQ